MIEAWFNERGYYLTTSKGESKFIYDLPDEVENDATSVYNSRWMVLNHVLSTLDEMGEATKQEELILNTDSRLIEELRGDITPQNSYAQSSLQYFMQIDYVKYKRVTLNKCSVSSIKKKF